MNKLSAAVLAFALLTSPVFAQRVGVGVTIGHGHEQHERHERRERGRDRDRDRDRYERHERGRGGIQFRIWSGRSYRHYAYPRYETMYDVCPDHVYIDGRIAFPYGETSGNWVLFTTEDGLRSVWVYCQ